MSIPETIQYDGRNWITVKDHEAILIQECRKAAIRTMDWFGIDDQTDRRLYLEELENDGGAGNEV